MSKLRKCLARWWLLRRISSRNATIQDLKETLRTCRSAWAPEIAAHISDLTNANGADQRRLASLL